LLKFFIPRETVLKNAFFVFISCRDFSSRVKWISKMRFLFSSLVGIFHLLRDFFYFMCGFRRFPAIGLLFPLFLDCFVCFEAITVTGKNESGTFFPYFLRVGDLFLSVRFFILSGR
jgi:hypothetical protein